MDLIAAWKHLARVAIWAVSQAAIAVHWSTQARACGRWGEALCHCQILAIGVVEVAAKASVLAHKSKAPNDVADRKAGMMVVVMVKFVIEGLQGSKGGVRAATARRSVASIAQRRHGVVEAWRSVLRLQGHGRAPEGGPGERC